MITNADVEAKRKEWKRRGYNNDQVNELTKSWLRNGQSQPTANHTHPSSPPTYDQLKTDQNGKKYSGMPIGAMHNWDYPNGKWIEKKIGACEWEIEFTARKRRHIPAPSGSGAGLGTQYHWYIVADQVVRKVSADEYETLMKGRKLKVGHKRPHWKQFSYKYPEQTGYTESVADYLRRMADLVEQGKVIAHHCVLVDAKNDKEAVKQALKTYRAFWDACNDEIQRVYNISLNVDAEEVDVTREEP